MTGAAPDPGRRHTAPGRGRPRRLGAPPGEGTGAVGTDTPPDPLDAGVEYPAQRGRHDTWPPPQGAWDAPPGPDAALPPRAAPAPNGVEAHPTGPLVTDPRAVGHPGAPPAPGSLPDGAPAPRAGTGPIGRSAPPTGPITAPGAAPVAQPQGPHGTAVGELEPVRGPDAPGPPPENTEGAEAPGEDEIPDEVDDLDLESDDADTASGWALVRASQDGDTAAFGQLFDRYHDVVFRFVLFRLGDRTAAEDLTQETFVRAFRRITSVSYQGRDIGAWFVTIARNLVLDHVKSSRYRLESSTPEIADVAPGSTRPGPEHEVIAGATHAELLRCVARLGDDQQECITLRFLQGLSVAETADIMGRNEGAVKALQHRAVRRLAQLLPEGLR